MLNCVDNPSLQIQQIFIVIEGSKGKIDADIHVHFSHTTHDWLTTTECSPTIETHSNVASLS